MSLERVSVVSEGRCDGGKQRLWNQDLAASSAPDQIPEQGRDREPPTASVYTSVNWIYPLSSSALSTESNSQHWAELRGWLRVLASKWELNSHKPCWWSDSGRSRGIISLWETVLGTSDEGVREPSPQSLKGRKTRGVKQFSTSLKGFRISARVFTLLWLSPGAKVSIFLVC